MHIPTICPCGASAEWIDEGALTRAPSKQSFFLSVTRRKHATAVRRMAPGSAAWEASVKSRVTVWKFSNRSLMPMVRPTQPLR